MSPRGRALWLLAIASWMVIVPTRAVGESCSRVVIFSVPGVTWADVARVDPPHIRAAAANGSVASISVRTVSSRTSYASGFATIGAGSRLEAGRTLRGRPRALGDSLQVGGLGEMRELAREAGYGARPGALAAALEDLPITALGNADLGSPPASALGLGRWTHLAAMTPAGEVSRAITGTGLLRRDPSAPWGVATDGGAAAAALRGALESGCGVVVVDQGDLIRAEQMALARGSDDRSAQSRALMATDTLVGAARRALDHERDLLMVVTPTSPAARPATHLGVAIAEGPGFGRRSAMESASTRRAGVVTLPDVAPTVLAHLGLDTPAEMTGRPWIEASSEENPVASALSLDRESVFAESMNDPVASIFVLVQVLVFSVATWMLFGRSRHGSSRPAVTGLDLSVLAIVAFPVSTYIIGGWSGHALGVLWWSVLSMAITAALAVAAFLSSASRARRLLLITAVTTVVLLGDLALGAHLQYNTVFGYTPIVAGRFAGIGNLGFALLGASALVTGVLIARASHFDRTGLAKVTLLFAVVVFFDGAPFLGSDVGGIVALVPGFGLAALVLSGRRPGVRMVALTAAAVLVALGIFLAFDLARPPESRTHLARLFEDVRSRGVNVAFDTARRKLSANLRVLGSSVWGFSVAAAGAASIIIWSRARARREEGSPEWLALRALVLGAAVLLAVGFAVNDSGVAIPAMMLAVFAPAAVMFRLSEVEASST